MLPSLAVVVVSYNVRELLRACLLSALGEGPDEIVVVDNASGDGSAEMVASEFPGVVLRVNAANGGYGAAANHGVAACSSPHILLLNADTALTPGTLHALRTHLADHPRAGVVGPRLCNPDGTLQASCFHFPTPLHVFLEVNNAGAVLRHMPFIRGRYLRTWRHDQPRVVPWVMGAALGIRRAAFDTVGGFDESYFMYSEEIDLCYRLRDAGWETHFVPAATVVHLGGASTAQDRTRMAVRALESTADFYRRHYSRRRLRELRLIFGTAMLAKLARDLCRWWVVRERPRRERIAEDIRVWRRVLVGLRTG